MRRCGARSKITAAVAYSGGTASWGAGRLACIAEWGTAMNGLKAGSQCASAFALLVLVSGCMQSRVEESRELHTKIQKDEAVVILAKPQIEGASAEDEFIDCVAGGLAGRGASAIATRTDE